MASNFRHMAWTFPFIFFFLGYFCVACFVSSRILVVPSLIGMRSDEALRVLASTGLSIRYLRQQEHADLPEGIVLNQNPSPHAQARVAQNVYVTLSKRPEAKKTPRCFGKREDEIQREAAKFGKPVRYVQLHADYDVGTCFAQTPVENSDFTARRLVAYISRGPRGEHVFPSLVGKGVLEVETFLKHHSIEYEVIHKRPMGTDHTCDACSIVEHMPMGGSIVDLRRGLMVQLLVA